MHCRMIWLSLISLIQGKYDEVNLNYVKENMRCEGGARYVEIQMEQLPAGDEILDSDMRSLQRKMHESCVAFLGADSAHCVFDVSVNEKVYDIGFIFSDYMAEEAAKTERKYLEDLRKYICEVKDGLVTQLGQVRGKKNVINKLIEATDELTGGNIDTSIMYIGYMDNEKEKDKMVEALKEKYNPDKIGTFKIGSCIGSHSGPGVLGILSFKK